VEERFKNQHNDAADDNSKHPFDGFKLAIMLNQLVVQALHISVQRFFQHLQIAACSPC